MAVNKVVCSGRGTILDLTSDTITSDMMFSGYTAHAANGEVITGSLDILNLTWNDMSLSRYNGDDIPSAIGVGTFPNRVVLGSRVLISLINDTVSETAVISGTKFHRKDGRPLSGTCNLANLTWNQYSQILNNI